MAYLVMAGRPSPQGPGRPPPSLIRRGGVCAGGGKWQGVSDMYDPFAGAQYTPAMQQYIAQYKPPDDSTFANCKPPGMPFVMNIVAMPMKFFPAPNMIALYLEDFGQTRFIHMDG